MSFCKNQKPEQTPGPICGNQINQLKDKVCIEVNKVFDACLKQVPLEKFDVPLANIKPTTSRGQNLKFISASSNNKSLLDDIEVSQINDGSGCSRVKGNVIIYLDVILEDEKNNPVTASGKITIPIDIVLFIPKGAVVDTSISATISCIFTSGEVTKELLNVNACITIIIKVVAPVDILLPTYGYCYIPPCQDYQTEVCSGMYDMPLYPKDRE